MTPRDDVLSLLKAEIKHAPEGEPFILKSGEESSWYLDCRPVTFGQPNLVGNAVLDELDQKSLQARDFTVVGGPALGAIPIAVAVGMLGNLRTFAVRPEPKDHGADGSLVIGDLRPGDRVLVVEDVLTSGGSLFHAIKEAVKAGAIVVAACVILYRGTPDSDGIPASEIVMPHIDIHDDQALKIPLISLYSRVDLGVSGG
jgi:orotate phosphoribosyltransferase